MPWWDIYTRLSKTILRNICWWTCYWHSWYTIWAAHHFFKTLVKKFDFTSAKKNARKVFWILYLQNQSIFIWRGPRFALELSDIDAPYILIMVMAHLPEISDNVSFIWSWIFVVTSFSEKLTNKKELYL